MEQRNGSIRHLRPLPRNECVDLPISDRRSWNRRPARPMHPSSIVLDACTQAARECDRPLQYSLLLLHARERVRFKPRHELLSFEEIERFVRRGPLRRAPCPTHRWRAPAPLGSVRACRKAARIRASPIWR